MMCCVKKRFSLAMLIAGVILLGVPAACSDPESPPTDELVSQVQAMEYTDVRSFRMTVSATVNSGGNPVESYQEAAFSSPDRYYLKMTGEGFSSEIISIGEVHYVKSQDASLNMLIAATKGASGYPTRQFTQESLEMMLEPKMLPPEEISGTRCFHYSGRFDLESQWEEMRASLDPAQPDYEQSLQMMESEQERVRQSTVEYELWIGSEDLLVRQVKYSARIPSQIDGEWETSHTTILISDINVPVEIAAPLDTRGQLLEGWELPGNVKPGVDFSMALSYKIAGDDPARRQVSIVFTIANTGTQPASDVRLDFNRIGRTENDDDDQWISAEPSSGPVELQPGKSVTFIGRYEADITGVAGDKFEEMVGATPVRITWFTPGGSQEVKFIRSGEMPYPSAEPEAR